MIKDIVNKVKNQEVTVKEVVLEAIKKAEAVQDKNALIKLTKESALKKAEELDKILKKSDREIEKVIALDVSDDEIIERITGRRVSKKTGKIYHIKYNPPVDENPEDLEQRADDNEETVKKRLAVYNEQTAPVLDFYKKQNKVHSVDGAKKLDEITEDIIAILEK
mgnify:CR=1 FL=1